MRRALVLAGGGLAGIAWELGVLLGLADEGVRVTDAALIVGTSAGATVAAQVTSGVALPELFAAQLGDGHSEVEVSVDLETLFARFADAAAGARSGEETRQRIGRIALDAATLDEPTRRAVVAGRLPTATWPTMDLRIVAVDAISGALRVFESGSGVDLVDAVTASSAVPGVWPAATIQGHRYVDGSIRSIANADLATDADKALILLPSPAGASIATRTKFRGGKKAPAIDFADGRAGVEARTGRTHPPNGRAGAGRLFDRRTAPVVHRAR